MDLNRETAMRLWGVFFGKKTNAVDYAGREIRKGAYNDRNSQFGWNVDHILPVSKGGKTADHNLICCHILTNDEKADSFPLFNANNLKFKIVKKQNHYEILNASDVIKNEEQKKTNRNDDVNFYDAADGIRLYKRLKGIQNKRRWIGYVIINLKDIDNQAIINFIEKIFSEEQISFFPKSNNINANMIGELTILITCESPYKEDPELDKCVLLNTYLRYLFKESKLISSYDIYYNVVCFDSEREYYCDDNNIKQNILRDINSMRSYHGSFTNTLYISELVNDNLVDTPKVSEEDKRGNYYNYDYYLTKLSKDLRKENEE